MTVDTAALTISATKTGEPTLTTTFIVSKLKQGRGAVSCYVDSSAGDLFLLSSVGDSDTTSLTAKIFEDETEIDSSGSLLSYAWYLDSEE